MKNTLIKVKQFIIKNLLGMIIGGVIVGSISMATANYAFESSNVYYNRSSSGGSYSNVQDSITELYNKANNGYKYMATKGRASYIMYENRNPIETVNVSSFGNFQDGKWRQLSYQKSADVDYSTRFVIDLPSGIDANNVKYLTVSLWTNGVGSQYDNGFRFYTSGIYTNGIRCENDFYSYNFNGFLSHPTNFARSESHIFCGIENNKIYIGFSNNNLVSDGHDSYNPSGANAFSMYTNGDYFSMEAHLVYK